MAPRGAMSQSRIFYTREWTAEIDKRFIETLVETSVGRAYKVPDHLNVHQIASGMGVVNSTFGTSFTFDYFVGRAMKLCKGYSVFKWIESLAGVIYNSEENTINVPQFVWDFICMKEKLGYAYMLKEMLILMTYNKSLEVLQMLT